MEATTAVEAVPPSPLIDDYVLYNGKYCRYTPLTPANGENYVFNATELVDRCWEKCSARPECEVFDVDVNQEDPQN